MTTRATTDSSTIERTVTTLITECGMRVGERAQLAGRSVAQAPIPDALDPRVIALLAERYGTALFSHQAAAIEAGLRGEDVCLATATASGKSLAFMATAANMLLRDRGARVLALYPARALIQDQMEKWQEILTPLGLRFSFIDGGIPVAERQERLDTSHVLLMTPDVTHAWLMSHLADPGIRAFLDRVRLLILDETHAYEGAFGTNMAYFLRRFDAVAGDYQLICSTATLGDPGSFVEQLTGRTVRVFGTPEDGSPVPAKSVLLLESVGRQTFEKTVELLKRLSEGNVGRFLAFADSRKAVELIVAACLRTPHQETQPADAEDEAEDPGTELDDEGDQDYATETMTGQRILPYRAGYETADRLAIQQALTRGDLSGVVSTSALELGIDIGEIDIVLLLDVPPSVKAFWQRIGRAGRRNQAVCVMFDPRGRLPKLGANLAEYLARPIEPNWLYLQNRYLQYANVLCAAFELSSLGQRDDIPACLQSLPAPFLGLLENELNPTELVPADLYQLKQRGQEDPHHEFALRGAVERNFKISAYGRNLGDVTFAQALREAYPGAIYYYMARPYRIFGYHYHKGMIKAKPSPWYTTRPLNQTMVFPRFDATLLTYLRSDHGFVAEAELQVSERVLGFTESRGPNRTEHKYAPGSPYSQRELTRFFETTGVCWFFEDRVGASDAVVEALLQTFAGEFGIQERDLGYGLFHANVSPDGRGRVQGTCIYDGTQGSLRLTQLLAGSFAAVVEATLASAKDGALAAPVEDLERLLSMVDGLTIESTGDLAGMGSPADDGDWAIVIAPGERAIFINGDSTQEVTVLDYSYTPKGLMYGLKHKNRTVRWKVPVNEIQPMYGLTRLIRVNLVTDEIEEIGAPSEAESET